MGKVLLPVAAVFILAVFAGFTYGRDVDEFLYLIGDYSGAPVWFQNIIEKKIELIEAGPPSGTSGGGERQRNFCGVVILRLRESYMNEIANIPDWFRELQVRVETTVTPALREEKIVNGDYPDWFKTWFQEYKERRRIFKDSGGIPSGVTVKAPTSEGISSTTTGAPTTEEDETTTNGNFFGGFFG